MSFSIESYRYVHVDLYPAQTTFNTIVYTFVQDYGGIIPTVTVSTRANVNPTITNLTATSVTIGMSANVSSLSPVYIHVMTSGVSA